MLKVLGSKYPKAVYGGKFSKWLISKEPKPYNSFGNGSAMRVSAIGWACSSLNQVLNKAKESAEITHNHPEGIKGAQATASAIFLAREGANKNEITRYIVETFDFGLPTTKLTEVQGIRNGGVKRRKYSQPKTLSLIQ